MNVYAFVDGRPLSGLNTWFRLREQFMNGGLGFTMSHVFGRMRAECGSDN